MSTCFPPCPPIQINDPEHSKLIIWVGGNHSNVRNKPTFQKLVDLTYLIIHQDDSDINYNS